MIDIFGHIQLSARPDSLEVTADTEHHATGFGHSLQSGRISITLIGQLGWRDATLAVIAERTSVGESILEAWRRYRFDLLKFISGHFALAIMDGGDSSVLLAVDRFASHTLAYAQPVGGGLVYGSSITRVSHASGRDTINPQSIYDYVYSHVIPSPATVFDGVHKLPPASSLVYTDGTVRIVEYWKPDYTRNPGTFDECTKELKRLIELSVSQSSSHGTTGCFLSGGLDSSTIAGVHAALSDGSSHAFTIGFDAEGYDEMQYAEVVADHFKLTLHKHYVNALDIVTSMPLIAAAYDEPFGNSSALPAFICAKNARSSGIDTMLAGDGGDEIFGGNERYVYQNVFRHYERLPAFIRQHLIDPVCLSLPENGALAVLSKVRHYVEHARTPLPDRLENYNFLTTHKASEMFDVEFLKCVDCDLPLSAKRERYFAAGSESQLQRMLYLDWKYTLADNDLRKVGKMSNLGGINVAYPLLADAIVDFSTSLPPDWLIKGNHLRYFFRESMSDFLPERTLKKSKHGFGLPFGIWLRTCKPLHELVHDCLGSLRGRQIFQPRFIDDLLRDHQTVHASYFGELIWILTILELWLGTHLKGYASNEGH